MPLLEVERVSRVFQGPSGAVPALCEVSFEVARGEWVAVTGPSGSGKSTLLHLLAALDSPTQGSIRFDGAAVESLDDEAAAALRARRVGLVFQAFHLLDGLSVRENVSLPLEYGPEEGGGERRVEEALEAVGLVHRALHRPPALSGGEAQRAAIARAIVPGPDLLLADEPTGNLDADSAEGILAIFDRLRGAGTALVVVTHNDRVARAADRTIRLREGRLA